MKTDRDEQTDTHTHSHTLPQTEVPPADYDVTQCLNFFVAEEATPRLSRNINMNSAGFYKDQF